VAERDNPADPSGKLLILAGRDSNEVLQAARGFALGRAVQKAGAVLIGDLRQPRPRPANDAPRWLKAGQITRIGDTVAPEQLREDGNGVVHWYFRLPPDLYLGQRGGVPLRLHYRYTPLAADARAEARVKVNGVDIGVKRFSGSEAASLFHTVEIPVAALYPRNTLTVEFQNTGGSRALSPVASLLKDSQIDLTGVPHFTTLPRLDLFAKAGFPFTRFADLSQTAVVLADEAQPEEIRAYLEMMGLFAAQTGVAGRQVEVLKPAEALHAAEKDLLVIGLDETHPLLASWSQRMPVRVRKDDLGVNRPESMWLKLWSIPVTAAGREFRRLTNQLASEAEPPLIIQSFVSPLNPHRCVVAIGATTAADLEPLADLIERSIQDEQIYGTVSLQTGNHFESFRLVDASYSVGDLGLHDLIDYWVYRWLWLVPIVILVIASFLASVASGWVEERAQRRLRGEP
jgi:cellulose synthase (UDP-forming)